MAASTADTTNMVAARSRFQSADHYGRLAADIAQRSKSVTDSGLVVDSGAGTGYYLAATLDKLPDCSGLALDISALALKRAAKAHPRIGAAVWDLWQPWPVKTGCAQVILNVFAPRNATEFHRILDPQGTLIVVSPQPEHLEELRSIVHLIKVDKLKEERLSSTFAEHFHLVDQDECVYQLNLSAHDIHDVVRMGPNAHHVDQSDKFDKSLGEMNEHGTSLAVTASFRISTYQPRKLAS